MQAFTSWVEEALRAFDLTHEAQVVGFGTVMWVRAGWPDRGDLADQEHKLIEALRVLRDTYNELQGEAGERNHHESKSTRGRRGQGDE